MFYKMITKKRDEWFKSSSCTVMNLIDYMIFSGQMRDAQIEAIKTYLFLKIACENKPLHILFAEGMFNSINFNDIELKSHVKEYLSQTPSTAALFEYAGLSDDKETMLAPKVITQLKNNPEEIDAVFFLKKAFYNVDYTDYLFSLPMGAGKTFLMASFIYLDLYFANNEPTNPAFAHNFIIFAPSGLKTSVVPSLRTIQNFDPSWILPEPAASEIKLKLIFEVLDQNKTATKSNKTKNPNVQKISIHQPLEELFGLVAVTNAEKVIYDRIDKEDKQLTLFPKEEQMKILQAAELRKIIGKLPNLCIYIDEVHHASAASDTKLRKVITDWTIQNKFNSVIGFSGTPYLQKSEKISIAEKLTLSSIEISNNVYYYPLVNGIGNFLKRPSVRISNSKNRLDIVESGIREFLDKYKDTVYYDGTCAKLGIYCGGNIETLEEEIYPLVERIATEYRLNSSESILRFHGGNKKYPIPVDSQLQFSSLDKPFSKIRIVLLVQIGKEGWDCKSLTGIVLSQEGDCPTNMVLQTSCRCLRQVQKGVVESALIYLNESNAETLNMQLKQQHNISIKEFENGNKQSVTKIMRYERIKHLKLPKVDFYQLKVNYTTLIIDESLHTGEEIETSPSNAEVYTITKEGEFNKTLEVTNIITVQTEHGNVIANFNSWVYEITKQSFGFINSKQLYEYKNELKKVFDKITYDNNGLRYFSSKFDIQFINSVIRKSFYEKRTFETVEELIPYEANLLNIKKFSTEINTVTPESYYPTQEMVDKIMLDDKGKLQLDAKMQQTIDFLIETGNQKIADSLKAEAISHEMKNKTFHYLPYKTDSAFEITFLDEVLKLDVVKSRNVEIYYNGDRTLTEFKIKCYKKSSSKWTYIGIYTPDFLIISRKKNQIYKVVVVETKGKIYANDPTFKDKRSFMETAFKTKNNEQFGYNRFEYLYLEDSLPETDRILSTAKAVDEFFKED